MRSTTPSEAARPSARASQHPQDFFDALLDSLEDGIVVCDANGVLSLFNRAARELHGRAEAHIPAEQWPEAFDLYHPDGRRMEPHEVPLARALRGEAVDGVEMVIAPRGRQRRLLSARGRAIRDAEGRTLGAVVAMHDVTARDEANDERVARRAAEEAERRVRLVLERITDAFFSVDDDWTITYVNEAASRFTGRRALVGANLWNEFPEARGTVIEAELRRSLEEQVTVQFEAYYPPPLDAWLALGSYPSPEGLSVFYRDVTARRRREEERQRLLEEERRLRFEAERRAAELDAILDNLPDQIFIGSTETFVRVNEPALRIMGFDSVEDIASDLPRFPERAQLRDAHSGVLLTLDDTPFAHARRGENVVRELTHVNPKTGEKRAFIAKATPIRVGGVITGVVAVHIDITERLQATKRIEALQRITQTGLSLTSLAELTSSLSAVLAGAFEADSAILALEDEQRRLVVSAVHGRAIERATTCPLSERIARSHEPTIVADVPNDPELAAAAKAGIAAVLGIGMRFRDGRRGAIELGFCARRELSEEDAKLLRVAADQVTVAVENARLYERLQEQVDRLETERRIREQFVATLTHDLRNPLAAAHMSAQLVLRKPDDVDMHLRLAHRVVENVARADKMIRDLLDANRLRAGQPLSLEMELCDVAGIVRSSCDELSTLHGDRFVVRTEGNTEGHFSCDGLRRVADNLLVNAVKYGDASAPIDVAAVERGDQVELSVTNRVKDRPLDPEDLASLFEPFRRTKGAEQSGKPGWGLGLALVRGLVDAHGGSVRVDSSLERGTTFTVTLPRRRV